MRPIKFRAWDVCGKKMLPVTKINWLSHAVWTDPQSCHGDIPMCLGCCILMQYTGLKDKNGKEIYEGDIVNITIRENIGTFNVPDDIIANGGYTGRDDVFEGEVIFQDFGFGVNDKENGVIFLQPMEDTFFEVIGNIYENPELLNTKEK